MVAIGSFVSHFKSTKNAALESSELNQFCNRVSLRKRMSTAKPMFWEPSGRAGLPLHTRASATVMMAKNLTRKEIFVKWTHKQGIVCSSSNENRKFSLHMQMTCFSSMFALQSVLSYMYKWWISGCTNLVNGHLRTPKDQFHQKAVTHTKQSHFRASYLKKDGKICPLLQPESLG